VERGAPWAFDLSVEAVKQRDFDGRFGFRDLQTVTALAAMHTASYQSTFTVRTGRFLSPDYGRGSRSNGAFHRMELGAWYTLPMWWKRDWE